MELSTDEQIVKVTQLFRNLRRQRSRPSANSASSAGLSSLTPSFISRPSTEIVDHVSPNDVLFGPWLTRPGNRQLRELVIALSDEYNHTDRGEKKNTVSQLVERIQRSGARFLKPSTEHDGKWEVVSNKECAQGYDEKRWYSWRTHW
ncbi:unnamed protein product [Cylindrotheca closterium]|uniref:DUF6824 domain-containing protein n=1 Tax=Cylindrotheca closterium TaxID=2856 RepID=A0AAD2CKM0_9STRA|nr:unnamed protein product [Cylindrotheca closterium]